MEHSEYHPGTGILTAANPDAALGPAAPDWAESPPRGKLPHQISQK